MLFSGVKLMSEQTDKPEFRPATGDDLPAIIELLANDGWEHSENSDEGMKLRPSGKQQ